MEINQWVQKLPVNQRYQDSQKNTHGHIPGFLEKSSALPSPKKE